MKAKHSRYEIDWTDAELTRYRSRKLLIQQTKNYEKHLKKRRGRDLQEVQPIIDMLRSDCEIAAARNHKRRPM